MPSNLSNILGGIQTLLQAQVTGLKVYKYPPDAVNDPFACLILPTAAPFGDMEQAFGGNTFKLEVILTVLVASGDPESGWAQLMEVLDPTQAATSIIRAIKTDLTLGGNADTCGITKIDKVGRRTFNDMPFFGADLTLEVYKSVA